MWQVSSNSFAQSSKGVTYLANACHQQEIGHHHKLLANWTTMNLRKFCWEKSFSSAHFNSAAGQVLRTLNHFLQSFSCFFAIRKTQNKTNKQARHFQTKQCLTWGKFHPQFPTNEKWRQTPSFWLNSTRSLKVRVPLTRSPSYWISKIIPRQTIW